MFVTLSEFARARTCVLVHFAIVPFVWPADRPRADQVEFPRSGLDMKPFIAQPGMEGDWIYDLYAVSVRAAARVLR